MRRTLPGKCEGQETVPDDGRCVLCDLPLALHPVTFVRTLLAYDVTHRTIKVESDDGSNDKTHALTETQQDELATALLDFYRDQRNAQAWEYGKLPTWIYTWAEIRMNRRMGT